MAPNPAAGDAITVTNTPVATTPTSDPRVAARDAIHRFLGLATGNAQTAVNELTDDDVAEVVAAAADRYTARQNIKAIQARAYDRRRLAAQREAGEKGEYLRRRALAQRVLEQELHVALEHAVDIAHKLSREDVDRLAELDGQEDVAGVAQAILDRAERVAQAAAADEPTDVIVSPETPAAEAATDVTVPEPIADEPA
jgi:hypothetical protein